VSFRDVATFEETYEVESGKLDVRGQTSGFQIDIKENKTPGGEHCLDAPGAELLA
jgi:hypothetical protein